MTGITRRNFTLGLSGACSSTLLLGGAKLAFASDSDTIKLGLTTALTGPYNEFGEGNKRGFDLAIDQWNANGGVNGRKVEIATALDDQLVPDRAAQNMRRLLDDPSLAGILGPAGSGPTMAVINMAEADGRPYINPLAQSPQATYPDGQGTPPYPNVFAFGIMNFVEAEVLGAYMAKAYAKIGVLHENTAYGVTGRDSLTAVIKEKRSDADIVVEAYNQRAADVTAQLVNLQRAGVEAVLVVGLGTDLVNIRRTMVRLGLEQPLVTSAGGLSLPYFEGAGAAAAGTIAPMVSALLEKDPRPEVTRFVESYKAKYGTDRYWGPDPDQPRVQQMSLIVVPAYDGANVLLEGMQRAGSTEPKAVIEAIEGMTEYAGVNAIYSFSKERHHGVQPESLSMLRIVDNNGTLDLELVED